MDAPNGITVPVAFCLRTGTYGAIPTMMLFLAGQIPLAPAFWKFAMLYGTAGNFAATLASLSAHVAGLPDSIGLVLFLLPVPYSIIAIFGVWRSAATYSGPEHWVTAAKAAVIFWAAVMLFI